MEQPITSSLIDLQRASAKDGTPKELRAERRNMIEKGKVVPNSPISPYGMAKKTVQDWKSTIEKANPAPIPKKSRRRNALQQYVDEKRRQYGSMDFNSTLSKSTADKYLKDSYDFSYETHGDRYIIQKKHTF